MKPSLGSLIRVLSVSATTTLIRSASLAARAVLFAIFPLLSSAPVRRCLVHPAGLVVLCVSRLHRRGRGGARKAARTRAARPPRPHSHPTAPPPVDASPPRRRHPKWPGGADPGRPPRRRRRRGGG